MPHLLRELHEVRLSLLTPNLLLVTEGGLSMAQVARDLGLDDNLVSRGKKEAQQNVVSPQRAKRN